MTDAADNQATNEATAETGAADTAAPADAATEGAPAQAAEAAESAQSQATEAAGPVRPEGLPDELWDDAKGVKVGDLWTAYREMKEAADAAKADVPDKPEGYELKPSEAVKLPEGYALDIDAESPVWKGVQTALHEAGVGKGAAQKLIDAFAQGQIAEQNQAVETYTAEKAKLGENADRRIEAVTNWLGANLTTDEAKAIVFGMRDAAAVAAIERLMKLATRDPNPANPADSNTPPARKSVADILYGNSTRTG